MYASPDQTSVPRGVELTAFGIWDAANKTADGGTANRITVSNGGLTVNHIDNGGIFGTIGIPVGAGGDRFYFGTTVEDSVGGTGRQSIGLGLLGAALSSPGADANAWAYDAATGNLYHNGVATAYGPVVGVGGHIGIAFNAATGDLWFSVDGAWQGGGDPAAGAAPAFSGLAGTLYPIYGISGSVTAQITSNFGQGEFAYPPPAGFLPGWGAVGS